MSVSIQLVSPNASDGTSWYRGYGPMSHLRRRINREVNFHFAADPYNWPIAAMSDIVYMQRPYDHNHVRIAEQFRDQGRGVWIDYDDDLFNLPTDNPVYDLYSAESTRAQIMKLCGLADIVTVSTKRLAEIYGKLCRRIEVIPNAVNEDLMRPREEAGIMSNQIIMWRGSHTHARDISCMTHQVLQVAADSVSSKWLWYFQGWNPWFLTDSLPKSRCRVGEFIDTRGYFDLIEAIKPAIVWVPLHNSGFNHGKSNIAWLEAIRAGALCVAPDWEEWRKPGVIRYKDPDDFRRVLADLMAQFNDQKSRRELVRMNHEAWDYIEKELTLDVVNLRREKILNWLVEKQTKTTMTL